MTKVKICGITNLEDAMLSAKFGADGLGFNFYEKSPRYILPEVAREIINEMPGDILKVGVFVNEDFGKIVEIAITANLDAIQLHGEETPEFAKELKTKTGLEIIKAFRVSEDFNPIKTLDYEWDTILLDSYSKKEYGGTGETFDWWIANATNKIHNQVFLAGGLNLRNIKNALDIVNPYGVDVCSGVELEKGKKDKDKLVKFFQVVKGFEVRNIDNIYKLFYLFEKYPDGYFCNKSLTEMASFLEGFASAIRLTAPNFEMDVFEHPVINNSHFYSWITKQTVTSNKNRNWKNFILEKFNGDEEKAFDYFFEQLEKFTLENNVFDRFKLNQETNE